MRTIRTRIGKDWIYRRTEEPLPQGIPISDEEWYELKRRSLVDNTQLAQYNSPLLVPREHAAELKKRLIFSLAGIKDLGNFIEPAAAAMAQLALSFDLNPFNQELWVIPQRRGQNIVGFSLFVGYKGLLRSARRVARDELHSDFMFGEVQTLQPEDIIERGAHFCIRCNGSGNTGKDYPCKKCQGLGKHEPKLVIVVQVSLDLFSKRKMAEQAGVPYVPTRGIGVWQPGDNISEGRDATWQAAKRARVDALRQEFDLPFSYGVHPTGGGIGAITAPEPPQHVEMARLAKITYEDEAAFIEMVDQAMTDWGFESAGHVLQALKDLGINHVSSEEISNAHEILIQWLADQDDTNGAPEAENGEIIDVTAEVLTEPEPTVNDDQQESGPLAPDELAQKLLGESKRSNLAGPISAAQLGLLVNKLNEVWAADPEADNYRRSVLKYVFGVDSAKDLTRAQAAILLDWLVEEPDDTGDYPLKPMAEREARLIIRQFVQDAGQIQMEGMAAE